MAHKLQWRLILIFILFIFAVMLMSSTFMLTSISSYYLNQFQQEMDREFSGQLGLSLNDSLSDADRIEKINEIMEAFGASRLGIGSNRNYYILDASSGEYIDGSDSKESYSGITDNIITAMSGTVGNEVSGRTAVMDYAYPVSENGVPVYIIYITDNKQEISTISYTIFQFILQAFLYGSILAVIFGFFMSRTITIPISNLTQKAGKMAEGQFDETIQAQGNDEIGTLTQTFNTMAQRLKETLRQIEGEKNKVEVIIRNLEDGVIAFDANGITTHTNPAAISMLNLDKDKVYKFEEIFPPLGIELTAKQAASVSSDVQRDWNIETESSAFSLHFAPFRTEGQRKYGIIVAISDITKQQKLDNSRKAFVANVSHELRTPLTNIKSYAETLLDSDIDPETTESFLQVINSEADRMTRLVRDLLVLSQLDHSSSKVLKTEPTDVSELVSDTVTAMRMDAKNRQLTLTYVPGSTTPSITADPDRIRQVIVNILSNAIKYTPAHGTVTVLCGQQENYVYIKISDTGIGIPEKDLPMLFERFYRVDKARSREMGGTGLGLAIAKEIVEAHNGSIDVESEYGKGTAVTIRLPIDK
ncbi:MAG: HAMP domain-containing protein [Clostridia bacterium]|nr:HAMP domain-containing protein [Clostridia bacterium]